MDVGIGEAAPIQQADMPFLYWLESASALIVSRGSVSMARSLIDFTACTHVTTAFASTRSTHSPELTPIMSQIWTRKAGAAFFGARKMENQS